MMLKFRRLLVQALMSLGLIFSTLWRTKLKMSLIVFISDDSSDLDDWLAKTATSANVDFHAVINPETAS